MRRRSLRARLIRGATRREESRSVCIASRGAPMAISVRERRNLARAATSLVTALCFRRRAGALRHPWVAASPSSSPPRFSLVRAPCRRRPFDSRMVRPGPTMRVASPLGNGLLRARMTSTTSFIQRRRSAAVHGRAKIIGYALRDTISSTMRAMTAPSAGETAARTSSPLLRDRRRRLGRSQRRDSTSVDMAAMVAAGRSSSSPG